MAVFVFVYINVKNFHGSLTTVVRAENLKMTPLKQ